MSRVPAVPFLASVSNTFINPVLVQQHCTDRGAHRLSVLCAGWEHVRCARAGPSEARTQQGVTCTSDHQVSGSVTWEYAGQRVERYSLKLCISANSLQAAFW